MYNKLNYSVQGSTLNFKTMKLRQLIQLYLTTYLIKNVADKVVRVATNDRHHFCYLCV